MKRIFIGMLSLFSCGVNGFSQISKTEDQIAVIGAGIAGLTAAHELRAQGYQNVRVFERSQRPGGKIKTVYLEGKPHEIGADWITSEYTTIHRLVKEYGLPLKTYAASKIVFDDNGESLKLGPFLTKRYGLLTTISSYIRFKTLYRKYRKAIQTPGLQSMTDPDLHIPIKDFVTKHKIEPIAKAVELFMVACGYGYFEDTPTIYILEMMDLVINAGILDVLSDTINVNMWGWSYFENGFQSLPQKMADDLGVEYGMEVSSIQRFREDDKPKVELTFKNGQVLTFDKVIVAFSPKYLHKMMELKEEEHQIFSQIRSLTYYSTLIRANHLRRDLWIGLFDSHLDKDTHGHIVAIGSYQHQNDYYQTTQYGTMDKEAAVDMVRADVEAIGGEMTEVIQQNQWDYFYHVDADALRDGFFQKFYRLQGKGGLFYVGGPASMESVEESAKFSVHLVQTFF